MKKPEFKSHILLVDTNILWFDDKKPPVDPGFDSFWDAHSKVFPLELAIPELVIAELKFQHNISARKAMENATKNLADVSNVTEASYKHRVTENKILAKIDYKYQKWINRNGAYIIPTPYADIDWGNIVENSVWRRAPFEFGERKDRSEKGFRDSVILETIISYVRKSSGEESISFICEDNLLRNTADKKLRDVEYFSVFESLAEFEAYIRLLQKDLTNEFIRSILKKVSKRFFNLGDENSLYYTLELREQVSAKSGMYTVNPALADPPKGLLGGSSSKTWTRENSGRYWVYPPVFQNIENENVYQWQTRIEFTQSFKNESPGLVNAMTMLSGSKLLLLDYAINWSIKIGNTARLWSPKLISIELVDKSFIYPSQEQREAYGLTT
jgi:hypothetical protein